MVSILGVVSDLLLCDIKDLVEKLKDHKNLEFIEKKLQESLLTTTYECVPKKYWNLRFDGFSDGDAFSTILRDKKVSVMEYFRDKLKIELKFPDLPLIFCIIDAKPKYFPMEYLNMFDYGIEKYMGPMLENMRRKLKALEKNDVDDVISSSKPIL